MTYYSREGQFCYCYIAEIIVHLFCESAKYPKDVPKVQISSFWKGCFSKEICLSHSRRVRMRREIRIYRETLKDKGTAVNPGRFAGDYEEWTD